MEFFCLLYESSLLNLLFISCFLENIPYYIAWLIFSWFILLWINYGFVKTSFFVAILYIFLIYIWIFIFFIQENDLFKNILLYNMLKQIHPIMLYFTFKFLLIILYHKKNFETQLMTLYEYRISNLIILKILIILTFLSGCWWALQESFWGGWWAWDFSEVILLNYFIIISLIGHFTNKQDYYSFSKIYFYIWILIIMKLMLDIFLSYNFHSFFSMFKPLIVFVFLNLFYQQYYTRFYIFVQLIKQEYLLQYYLWVTKLLFLYIFINILSFVQLEDIYFRIFSFATLVGIYICFKKDELIHFTFWIILSIFWACSNIYYIFQANLNCNLWIITFFFSKIKSTFLLYLQQLYMFGIFILIFFLCLKCIKFYLWGLHLKLILID